MYNTDIITIWIIHVFLLFLFLYYLLANVVSKYKERHSSLQAKVTRGNESMNMLYIFYGVISLIYALAIQVADYGQNHKSAMIVLDYVLLTYLFFFNGRFRNMIIGIYIRLKND
jgi:purine-cytosine permease-like protein